MDALQLRCECTQAHQKLRDQDIAGEPSDPCPLCGASISIAGPGRRALDLASQAADATILGFTAAAALPPLLIVGPVLGSIEAYKRLMKAGRHSLAALLSISSGSLQCSVWIWWTVTCGAWIDWPLYAQSLSLALLAGACVSSYGAFNALEAFFVLDAPRIVRWGKRRITSTEDQ